MYTLVENLRRYVNWEYRLVPWGFELLARLVDGVETVLIDQVLYWAWSQTTWFEEMKELVYNGDGDFWW